MDFPQHVLIIDDDPIQRAVLRQVFTSHGSAAVETAADCVKATSIIENSTDPFDLIVLELMMPEYEGIELISYLESQNVRAGLLLMSRLPRRVVKMSDALARASGLRSIGGLKKPFALEDLLATVGDQRWHRMKVARREQYEASQLIQALA